MKNSRPRTPGGRYADGSSANPAQSWKAGNFMPVRAPKPKAATAPTAPKS
ncbi:MAG: hypothetical protein WCP06_02185 [Verrucomicrobiota bacterium]